MLLWEACSAQFVLTSPRHSCQQTYATTIDTPSDARVQAKVRVSEKKKKVPVCMRVCEPVCVCVRARALVRVGLYVRFVC